MKGLLVKQKKLFTLRSVLKELKKTPNLWVSRGNFVSILRIPQREWQAAKGELLLRTNDSRCCLAKDFFDSPISPVLAIGQKNGYEWYFCYYNK